jgi:hypothetical protein
MAYNSSYDGSTDIDVGVSSTSIFLIHAPIEPLRGNFHLNRSMRTPSINLQESLMPEEQCALRSLAPEAYSI